MIQFKIIVGVPYKKKVIIQIFDMFDRDIRNSNMMDFINAEPTISYTYEKDDGVEDTEADWDEAVANFSSTLQLVDILRKKLQNHYKAYFDEIDVQYDKFFGTKSTNYGDFDLVFFTKETNELFLIEAKFFSDSLNNSGIISDYEKLYKTDGYYDHCRKRYDLVLREPQKIKSFIGAQAPVKAHFLFVSSKPLEIEFQDDDGVVIFPCLSIFDKYFEGKLIVDEDDSIMRPIHMI